jgi:hypothetical protein
MDTIAGAQRQHAEVVVLDLVVVPGDLGLVLALPMALLPFLAREAPAGFIGAHFPLHPENGRVHLKRIQELCSLTIARSSIRAA